MPEERHLRMTSCLCTHEHTPTERQNYLQVLTLHGHTHPSTIRPQFQALEIQHFFFPQYKTKNACYSERQLETGFST